MKFSTLVAFAGLCLASITAQAEPRYSVAVLDTLAGGRAYFGANTISNGYVGGYFRPSSGGYQGTIISLGKVIDTGTLGGKYSSVLGLNAGGRAVGFSYTASDPGARAFLYNPVSRKMQNLGTLPGGYSSSANAINSGNQVVGVSGVVGGKDEHAFLWHKGVMTDLGTLGTGSSSAKDINDFSQIVGSATAPNAVNTWETHAVLWENGVIRDLGTLGGATSRAAAINGVGSIAGTSLTASGESHPFLWADGVMYDLGKLDTSVGCEAVDVNDNDQVIGQCVYAPDNSRKAFLYQDGAMTELNTLVPAGWNLMYVYSIDHSGAIVATGTHPNFTGWQMVLLTPFTPNQ